mmetsp:Transcript_129/g.382  ORF Transcript_129/g.382 Transcript_129/m.382 type:complete len:258 (-) Transcript_129:406-1179(-)
MRALPVRQRVATRAVGQRPACLDLGLGGQFGRNGDGLGALHAQEPGGILLHERDHLVHILTRSQKVNLVDDEHDLFPPLPHVLEELDLALRERSVGRQHKEHEIGARNELLREPLLPLKDHVRSRRVDDIYRLENLGRGVPHEQPVHVLLEGPRFPIALVGVLDHRDFVGCGQNPLWDHRVTPQQGVHHGRLAGVEFSHDHHEEQLVQLLQRIPEKGHLLQGRRRRREESDQILEEGLLPGDEPRTISRYYERRIRR